MERLFANRETELISLIDGSSLGKFEGLVFGKEDDLKLDGFAASSLPPTHTTTF